MMINAFCPYLIVAARTVLDIEDVFSSENNSETSEVKVSLIVTQIFRNFYLLKDGTGFPIIHTMYLVSNAGEAIKHAKLFRNAQNVENLLGGFFFAFSVIRVMYEMRGVPFWSFIHILPPLNFTWKILSVLEIGSRLLWRVHRWISIHFSHQMMDVHKDVSKNSNRVSQNLSPRSITENGVQQKQQIEEMANKPALDLIVQQLTIRFFMEKIDIKLYDLTTWTSIPEELEEDPFFQLFKCSISLCSIRYIVEDSSVKKNLSLGGNRAYYEKSAIQTWLNKHQQKSPLTNEKLNMDDLIECKDIQAQIDKRLSIYSEKIKQNISESKNLNKEIIGSGNN
jgi:U-box domain